MFPCSQIDDHIYVPEASLVRLECKLKLTPFISHAFVRWWGLKEV